MAFDPIAAGLAHQRRRGARTQQLAAAEEIARLEAQQIKDRACWSTMSREQRTLYSRYLNGRRAVEAGEFSPPLGPSSWLAQQRIEAAAQNAPWDAASQWLQTAEGSGREVVHAWIRKRHEQLDAARKRLQGMASDLAQREAFVLLEAEIKTEERDLDRIDRLDQLGQFGEWEDARPSAEQHREELRRRAAELAGADPDAVPDSGEREDVDL